MNHSSTQPLLLQIGGSNDFDMMLTQKRQADWYSSFAPRKKRQALLQQDPKIKDKDEDIWISDDDGGGGGGDKSTEEPLLVTSLCKICQNTATMGASKNKKNARRALDSEFTVSDISGIENAKEFFTCDTVKALQCHVNSRFATLPAYCCNTLDFIGESRNTSTQHHFYRSQFMHPRDPRAKQNAKIDWRRILMFVVPLFLPGQNAKKSIGHYVLAIVYPTLSRIDVYDSLLPSFSESHNFDSVVCRIRVQKDEQENGLGEKTARYSTKVLAPLSETSARIQSKALIDHIINICTTVYIGIEESMHLVKMKFCRKLIYNVHLKGYSDGQQTDGRSCGAFVMYGAYKAMSCLQKNIPKLDADPCVWEKFVHNDKTSLVWKGNGVSQSTVSEKARRMFISWLTPPSPHNGANSIAYGNTIPPTVRLPGLGKTSDYLKNSEWFCPGASLLLLQSFLDIYIVWVRGMCKTQGIPPSHVMGIVISDERFDDLEFDAAVQNALYTDPKDVIQSYTARSVPGCLSLLPQKCDLQTATEVYSDLSSWSLSELSDDSPPCDLGATAVPCVILIWNQRRSNQNISSLPFRDWIRASRAVTCQGSVPIVVEIRPDHERPTMTMELPFEQSRFSENPPEKCIGCLASDHKLLYSEREFIDEQRKTMTRAFCMLP